MSLGFLLDENLPTWWRAEISRRHSQLVVWCVGDPGAPSRESSDPVILEWCGTNHFVLITNNRASMPRHLAGHVAGGRHVPGIFIVDPGAGIDGVAEILSLIEGASLPDEHQDQIRYLPIL
jgi:hypothetical protein